MSPLNQLAGYRSAHKADRPDNAKGTSYYSTLGPTFLYLGAPKAGSTWLFQALKEHPEVFVPDSKSLDFFDVNYDRGIDWYKSCFSDADPAAARGEISHDYFASPEVPQRIKEHFPDVRLIVCLREPGDFAISVLKWWSAHTTAFGASLDEMIAHPHFRNLMNYRANLERIKAHFAASQLLVLFYEDLSERPDWFLSQVYRFIGVSEDFEALVMNRKVNPTRPPRNRMLLQTFYRLGGVARRLGAAALVERAKSWRWINSMLYGDLNRAKSAADDDFRFTEIAKKVRSDAAKDQQALAALIGRPLPKSWLAAAGN